MRFLGLCLAFAAVALVLAMVEGCVINTRRPRPGPPVTCTLVAMRCSVETGAAPPPPLTIPK